MKKIYRNYLLLLLCLPIAAMAQQPSAGKAVLSSEKIQKSESYQPIHDQIVNCYHDASVVKAGTYVHSLPPLAPTGKTAQLNPIALGTSSNSFTALRGEQNQVCANSSMDLVAFIHRQDIGVWGGAGTDNGKYRYDFSVDGGATFVNDIGPLQTLYTNYGRYPNITSYQPTGVTNPFNSKLVWGGPTNRFPTPGWVGHVYGVADVIATSPPPGTEQYLFDLDNTLLPGGMCEGLPGEFWMVEFEYDGTNLMDGIRVMKGVWNSGTQDVAWTLHTVVNPGYDMSADGSRHAVGPNIAFSPDGMTGYIGILSNILTGSNPNNNVYLPVLIKSTDGGATWGAAKEVNIDAIPWVSDSLQTLWTDSLGNPASDGIGTCAFDFDMVVDKHGSPHLSVVIGTHSSTAFAISSGLAKFLADVWSPDGGNTWDMTYLSPVLTFRGSYGAANPITVDNFVQVSRDEAGEYVFFSWADSDTSFFTGSQNGIGFGEVANINPNLRVTAKRVFDNALTYPKLITDGDLIWEGRALNPTISPKVLLSGGVAKLPIVVLQLLQDDGQLPTAFWYFGNDATFDVGTESIWCEPSSMTLDWLSISTPGATPPCAVGVKDNTLSNQIVLHPSYPNPTAGKSYIGFELPAATSVTLSLTNMYGQQVATLANGEYNSGAHLVTVETGGLAAGIYFYNLHAGGKVYSNKMMVTK